MVTKIKLLEAGVLLQDAATTGNGVAYDCQALNREAVFYVIWSAGVSAGAVTIETADAIGYAGTWAPLATVNFGANKTDVVQISGALRAVRARISTAVVGGTVTVRFYAN